MGPDVTYDISSTKLTVPKLTADGSNWPTYQERVTNAVISKKLRRHLTGTARKPAALVEREGNFYENEKSLAPLSDKEIDKIEDMMEEWSQKEAQVREIIYSTVDQSTFHQVKGEPTAAAVWKKLASIHSSKGAMYETDLLAQLQNARFIKNGEIDMCTHLANLVVIKECLAEIRCPLSDASFVSYIRTSLSLAPTYKPLFTMLAMSACTSGKSVSNQDLIWHLNKEANSAAIETSINHQHEAMIAAHAKACGSSKDEKGKSNRRENCHCDNCKRDGNTKDKCFEDGGGMVGKAPKWWLKKHKEKEKDKADKSKSANAAITEEKEENYAFLTCLTINTPNYDIGDNVALAVMSRHSHEAHATSPSTSIIIDCGASSHFFPSHKKFLNYQEISPEPVHAANGHTFSTLSRGDLHICLPMKTGEKSVPILLKRLHKAGKLESKVEEVKLVGIDEESKGYRIYWPGKGRVTIERDVYFSKEATLNLENV
ncbi:hypothetical protein E4T56_gene13059 [Termitomyces sp. T112]|nr:hypothetical protein E4T56_gene13059 [Termitomyces sp. T112]